MPLSLVKISKILQPVFKPNLLMGQDVNGRLRIIRATKNNVMIIKYNLIVKVILFIK